MKTWGLTPRRVQEHSAESRRVYCTDQEFLPGVVTKALNHQWELQGWLQLEEAVPRPRAAIWCRLPFHISGDELLQSSLTAAPARASALHNWGELNMWLFLVPLQPEAFFLVCGEDQDCTLSWRNQTKPSFFFWAFPFLGAHLEMCWT